MEYRRNGCQFRDYVLAEQSLQQTELYQRSQNYWFSRLDNFPPAPDLPLAKNPKELKQHRCQRYQGYLQEGDRSCTSRVWSDNIKNYLSSVL
ncbi:hypothetical protein [Nostoc sp.]|uniref:hypothetical protein n=1 Tax=Nostoc sp. TaxID=1180 RepID=UPI002FFA13EC